MASGPLSPPGPGERLKRPGLIGLKQGDNLSPILFGIFFDDVDDIFDSECDPVILSGDTSDISLNHSLYADDMALLSLPKKDYNIHFIN